MKKLVNQQNIGWTLAGVLAVGLLFMVLFIDSKPKPKPYEDCPTIEIEDSAVICLGTSCDTVNKYYYNHCNDCISYKVDSASVYIIGSYTVKNIPEISVKPKNR